MRWSFRNIIGSDGDFRVKWVHKKDKKWLQIDKAGAYLMQIAGFQVDDDAAATFGKELVGMLASGEVDGRGRSTHSCHRMQLRATDGEKRAW